MPPSHRDGTREGARTLALLERLRLAASTGIKRSGIESVPLARLSAVLSLFVVGDLVLMRACHIPGDAYTHPVIAVALARHLFSLGPASIAVLLGLVSLIGAGLWRRSFGSTWDALDGGRRLRALCLVTCLILTWAYATYAFNYVAGQGHLVDRLLLILLIPLVWWRPAFLVPYLLVLLPVIWQFDAPIGGFSWSEPALLTRLLILVGAAYAVQTLAGRLRTGDVFFLIACLVATHYWVSGYGKLVMNWFELGHIPFMLPATYANGWLGFLEPEAIARWTRALGPLDGFMKAATLALECGALFFLASRRFVPVFLVGWISMHVGIVIVSGIFFWKWIALNLALLIFFGGSFLVESGIFSTAHAILSILLIGTGVYWARPIELAWYEVPIGQTYRLEAETESGQRIALPPHFFAPFDYPFTLGNFGYLSAERGLPIVWGTTSVPAIATSLRNARTLEHVQAVEADFGRIYLRPERRNRFGAFLQEFVGSKSAEPRVDPWRWVRAPSQLWTFPRNVKLPAGDPVRSVNVRQVLSLYDGESYREIRSRSVLSVELAPTRPRTRSRTD